MKQYNRILSFIISFSILFTLLISTLSPIVAHAEGDAVVIENAEDFMSFAKKCSYDLWSRGKTFILGSDISLEGIDFSPIPVFSGTFDGNGHTISGLNIQGAASPAGLFAIIEKDGVIEDLIVTGVVAPDGDADTVGGICGENYGSITNCSFMGTVIGSNCVGGIAGTNKLGGGISGCLVGGEIIGEVGIGGITGKNEGLISYSESKAKVNTVSITPSLSLDEINISLTLDVSKLPSLNMGSISDVGGIAGESIGMILGCTNNGRVGYPHIGYNVGGIVGRSNGHINGCINNVEVFGRKDVGGIAGQMEPHISYDLSEDLLLALKNELDSLSSLVTDAVSNADSSVPNISTRLDSIIKNLDGATDSLDTIIDGVSDYGGDMTAEINRMSEILRQTLIQISDVTEALPSLSSSLSDGLTDIEKALDELDEVSKFGAKAFTDIIKLIEDAVLASESIKGALENLEIAIELLKNSVEIKDQTQFEAALDILCDGLFDIVDHTDDLAGSLGDLIDVLGDNIWLDDAITQLEMLADVAGNASSAVKSIYDATLEIKNNTNIYWSEIQVAGDNFVIAIDSFASAMSGVSDSLDLMDSALLNITDGIDGLLDSVEIKDPESTKAAAKKVVEGLEELVNAAAKSGESVSACAEALRKLEEEGQIDAFIGALADAMEDMAIGSGKSVDAMTKLSGGLKIIFDNITIDFDQISDSSGLLISGVRDMTDAMRGLRATIGKMSAGMVALDNAIEALSRAVVVDDQEKIDSSLEEISLAIGEMVSAMEESSTIFENTVAIMKDAKLWSDEIIASLSDVMTSVKEITSAIAGLREGVDLLRDNFDFDFNSANAGLDAIIAGISDTADGIGHIKNAMLHLSDALVDIQAGTDKMGEVASLMADGIFELVKALNTFESISDDIHSIVKYLMGIDPIQLPSPPESATEEANRLFIYIDKIERELKYLNSDITSLSSDLIEKIGRMNELFHEMCESIVDIIYNLENGDILDNKVTESEIDKVTNGKLFSCQNNGRVEGDINVGGISGAMGVEYALDPEDDYSGELSVTQKKQYKLKAVIHASVNCGEIVAKYDSVGGITGKMDFGLIYQCESYGSVESTAGSYVGGIAGIAAGRISECYAKCTLDGNKYVGGIVGSGVKEDYSGDSSMVSGCYSMVEILNANQYFGAVSGANAGEYEGNLFISEALSGIDRISYHGKAEPIEYEDLTRSRAIPSRFLGFILKFEADGVVLKTVEFEYKDSFDSSVFPEIPKKEGHYGEWDRTELKDLIFDTTVSVIYTPFTTAISSDEKRDDGREIFIVIGKFTEDAKISVDTDDASDLPLEDKFFTRDSLAEAWVLTLSENGDELNRIHLLPSTDHARVFVKIDGVWTQIEAEKFGSYLAFEITGESAEIAVVRHSIKVLPIAIICTSALLLIAAVIITLLVKKKRKETA